MKRGAAHVTTTIVLNATSHAHTHHHVPILAMSQRVTKARGATSTSPRNDRLARSAAKRRGEIRLNPKRAPQRKRQAEQLERQEHRQDDETAMPGFARHHRPHPRIHRRETSAYGEADLDHRLDDGGPPSEANPGERIVGGLLLVGKRNLPLKSLGYAIAMGGDRVDLAGGQPQARHGFCGEGRKEHPSEPIHRSPYVPLTEIAQPNSRACETRAAF